MRCFVKRIRRQRSCLHPIARLALPLLFFFCISFFLLVSTAFNHLSCFLLPTVFDCLRFSPSSSSLSCESQRTAKHGSFAFTSAPIWSFFVVVEMVVLDLLFLSSFFFFHASPNVACASFSRELASHAPFPYDLFVEALYLSSSSFFFFPSDPLFALCKRVFAPSTLPLSLS